MTRRENGCVVDLALIDAGPSPTLPCRIVGLHSSVTVDRCGPAWLLRKTATTDVAALPGSTMAADHADGLLAWLSPYAWLLLGAINPARLEGTASTWIDVSARYISVRVKGDAVGFVTALTGLDSAAFHPGRSLPTRMAGLPVSILPRADHILILAECGRERYWLDWLRLALQAD